MRIAASSYSNTAPLIWSFLYGTRKGSAELVLDNAPARSLELLASDRVDVALVPVIAFQYLEGLRIIPEVCVGSIEKVKSVCLVTRGKDVQDVSTVALDVSSKTSVTLTKILFREFFGSEPRYVDHRPDVDEMLDASEAALLIGDPALEVHKRDDLRKFDLVELWRSNTGLGFIFAMWMTRNEDMPVDFNSAMLEGCDHFEEIASSYEDEIALSKSELTDYLRDNIKFETNLELLEGLDLYFELAAKHGFIETTARAEICGRLTGLFFGLFRVFRGPH